MTTMEKAIIEDYKKTIARLQQECEEKSKLKIILKSQSIKPKVLQVSTYVQLLIML